ncbi:hypothetical protein [Elizabethkingia anophelis]|uniref:hypothetical protein n=1 Tax=Elizabethkingia anophelis TaxID=1117645 RepID=UPI000D02C8BB|nr:hypothetical protein [Elizabethkingia anophelis]MCL1689434.1 hypothetical protein [Elizabethkingia anophelis]MDV4009435.1 hypothetical protein [Elizabethkingia anophelis]MYY46375.1 hypothetical protein [Elizabethkingia anophelis]PRQ84117.1 hypothetical protein CMT86_17845 [Elizabethkingia anophelis]PRQ85017.1 hypothetical protein CMT87_02295 [Elizabethkingia anophelis]
MKKYLSILSLASVLFMCSCERDDSDWNNPQQKEQSPVMQKHKISALNKSSNSQASREEEEKTNDDDEPKRDKQHWRVKKDTVNIIKP